MRRKRGKKLLAGFLALTLFLTSGFLFLFRDSVFGAKNENGNPGGTNPYIDTGAIEDLSVYVRGKDGATGKTVVDENTGKTTRNIILTNEGSNQQNKDPKTYYKGWEFTNDDGTISIPGTEGKKGTINNPFVVLEVVPDKAQQELTYFVGSSNNGEDNGLGFDEGYLSATLMEKIRKENSTLRLVNNNFTVEKSQENPQAYNTAYESFIGDMDNPIEHSNYGRFLKSDFEVLNYGKKPTKTPLPTTRMIDVRNESSSDNKTGYYDFNEIYNIDISLDDLIKIDPMEKDEVVDETGKTKVTYSNRYSKYLKALASTQTGNSDDERVNNLINNVLKDYIFDYRVLRSSKNPNVATKHVTGLVKYDVTEGFMQGNKVFANDFLGIVTGAGNEIYDVTWSKLGRSSVSGSGENAWKINFKKYYVDHFEDLYEQLWEFEKDHTINDQRDAIMKRILQEYAPIFEDKGATLKTTEDYLDWESTGSKDVISEMRKYKSEPQGGYVLAVKPGMGEMYLITDENEIKALGGKKGDIIFGRDKSAPTFDTNGNLTKLGDPAMRWIYVPSQFALNGAQPHGTGKVYQIGYLDDERYTNGFVSKSIIDSDTMWMAIYDRNNRKFHSGNVNVTDNDNKISVTLDDFSKKMLFDTDVIRSGDTNRLYNHYQHNNTDGSLGKALDPNHLNVSKMIFGDGAVTDGTINVGSVSGIIDNNTTNNPSRRTTEIKNIFEHDNLIDTDGQAWFRNSGNLGNSLNKGWLFNGLNGKRANVDNNSNRVADSKYITGLCFNLYDLRIKDGKSAVGSYPDIYNLEQVLNPNGYTYHSVNYEYDSEYRTYTRNHGYYAYDNGNCICDIPVAPLAEPGRTILADRYRKTEKKDKDGNVVEDEQGNPVMVGAETEQVPLVSKDQLITEKVKSYHFTYYGFKANPILQRSLFVFTDSDDLKNFYVKAICVTPSELNQIAQAAKDYNLDDDTVLGYADKKKAKEYEIDIAKGKYDTNEDDTEETRAQKEQNLELAKSIWSSTGWNTQWSRERLTDHEKTDSVANKLDLEHRLDLIERADMFYIHTQRTSRQENSNLWGDDVEKAYEFYKDIVSQGDSKANKQFNSLPTFFENDLEWEQVMKLIKRSSLDSGINIPILFNMQVGYMTDISVDCDGKKDTHMQLYSNPDHVDLGEDKFNKDQYVQDYSGNLNNIAKMYTILTQFDLHAVRKTQVNPGVTDESQKRYVRRTFMGDIYKKLKQAPIKNEYKPKDMNRLPNSAKMTGVVPELEIFSAADRKKYNNKDYRGRVRALCLKNDKNKDFEENALYLWNRFTFYPYDIITEKDQRAYLIRGFSDEMKIRFLEWGYLESYYRGSATQNVSEIFKDGEHTQSLQQRVGTDGKDGQNVYVLHWPDSYANQNAAGSLLGNYGQKPNHVNLFMNTAYLIMGYPGKASSMSIKVLPRNKVYTMMGRDSSGDHIMLDYSRQKNLYTKAEYSKLLADNSDNERNILVSATNINSYPAFITSVSLHRKSDGATLADLGVVVENTGNTGQNNTNENNNTNNSANQPAGENDTGNEFDDFDDDEEDDPLPEIEVDPVPVVFPSVELTGKIALNKLLQGNSNPLAVYPDSNNKPYEIEGTKADGTTIEQGQGLLVDSESTVYFYIPFTLSDFLEKRTVNGEEVGGYDEIWITGYYYIKNLRDHTMSINGVKHLISIDERDLFNLE